MTANYKKIKELFSETIALPREEQSAFISKIQDKEIKKEVASLVQNHIEEFTISIDTTPKKIQPYRKRVSKKSQRILKLLFGNKFKIATTLTIISLFILGVGVVTKISVKKALIDIRHNELSNMINSNQLTMNVWIEEQKKLVEILSKAPRVTNRINYLATTYGFGKDGNTDTIWNDQVHNELNNFLEPILQSEGIPLFSVLDKTGYRIATNKREDLGQSINREDLSYIANVFSDNEITFTHPTLHHFQEYNSSKTSNNIPLTWIDAPIHDSTGKIIATLGLAYFANEGFSKFLDILKTGQEGESYAFDRQGLLVSNSRFERVLKDAGIIEENQNPILNVTLRNPQVNLKTCNHPPENYSSLPLTIPIAEVLAKADSDSIIETIITEPYLNYIGEEVIGAAIWLPNYNFGIVTEIPTCEAYAALYYLNWVFIILIAILFSLAIYSTLSSFSLFKIRDKSAQKIGPYFIKEQIGEGGMGEVYLAEHQLLKRPTAIKKLKKTAENSANNNRFEREVLLASKLTHPNTIQIYDFGRTDDESFYFAMEYLKGINLSQLSDISGIVCPERVTYILLQVCYSLKEAHHLGLIHRDIKPQNIMICNLGDMYDVVKVLDFGLVKDIESQTDESLTNVFEIGGTPMYMSPERLTAPQLVDYRTDIYSVGVLAYFLLTAQKPFLTGVTDFDLMNQVINEVPLEIKSKQIPKNFSKLIMQCMEKDPTNRPADMEKLIALLEEINTNQWNQQKAKDWWVKKILTQTQIE